MQLYRFDETVPKDFPRESSAYGLVAASNAVLREDDLPEMVLSRTKQPGTGQEIELPHPVESLVIFSA